MPGYGKGPEMKKHGKGPHMESAKQERKDLMKDNPVARTAAGNRPWISKHYKSGMNYGSPMKLEGGQVKLDKNKNGKIDAEDFKMMRSNSDIKMDHK
jgi:hypothetical protein